MSEKIPADIMRAARSAFEEAMRFNTDHESELVIARAILAERERAWNAGYLEGFMGSAEGWNGEYPFEWQEPEDDARWVERRDEIREAYMHWARKMMEEVEAKE